MRPRIPSGPAPQDEATLRRSQARVRTGAAPMLIESTFPLGRIVITANAHDSLTEQDVHDGLVRHAARDWGDLDSEDRRLNDYAVENDVRILSAYRGAEGAKFWIITEWDRSSTTILLPEDY